MDRTAWMLAFSNELERLRPHLAGGRMPWTIGSTEWPQAQTLDPVEAARRYHGSQAVAAPAAARRGKRR